MRGTIVLSIVLVTAAVAPAQAPKDTAQPAGTMRVAVVNIGIVFNKYERAQTFKKELEATLTPFKLKAAKLQQEMKDWKKQADAPNIGEAAKAQLDANILKNQRQLEDMDQTVKRLLGKKQEANLVTLWKEVQNGIREYAAEKGIELVFGYGDPMDRQTLDLFPNVNRKMQAMDTGSAVPLFMIPRAEIGEAVAARLNRQLRDKQAKEPQGKSVDLE